MVIDLNRERRQRQTPLVDAGRVIRLDEHGLLLEVALVLNSTLELRDVLHRLAELTLEATGADRCSLFLLDDHLLEPAVAIGRVPDEDLWAAFQEMGPVDLTELPAAAERLMDGELVVVEDAAGSDLLPAAWVERFALRSLVLVPLVVGGEPCGVLAVDYQVPRRFGEGELELLDAIGAYASVAVRNARLFDTTRRRARLQEAVARGAAALASPTDVTDVVTAVVDAHTDLPGVRGCAIALFDATYSRLTLIDSTVETTPSGPLPVSSVPAHLVERLTSEWERRPRPIGIADEPWLADLAGPGTSHLVLPLVIDRRVGGAVILACAARPGPEERASAAALAAITAATLERTRLLERLALHGRRFEALYALSTSLVEGTDATSVTARLNGLLATEGIEVLGMSFRDRRLGELLGTPKPTKHERAAMRRDPEPGAELLPDGSLGLPMRLDRRVVGLLRVRPADVGEEERSFLEALARGVAEVASRGALRAALDAAAREQAVADERDRLAADLHDSAGQMFVAISLVARRCLEHLPADSPWRDRFARIAELAEGGKWELEQSIRALTFVPATSQGLVRALHDLTRSTGSDSGLSVLLDVDGELPEMDPAVERALYRVASEALANAWRHARCAVVRVALDVEDDDVRLAVRDDGVGLPGPGVPRGGGHGIANMNRTLAGVGGEVRVRNAEPRGVLVEARAPVGGR